ncbi:hypothetical protein DRH14_00080 [Candidatus Shapirobacteria bacterium]|nr:MAG: hypothetical protein DRH14_00080 [Candidatus Shapirobacteria bacterium]
MKLKKHKKFILAGIFGSIKAPQGIDKYIGTAGNKGNALFLFMNNIFKLIGVVAGIFTIFQFLMAGFAYISASGEPKKIELAWAKIWQAIIGLVIVASAFVIAGVIGRLTQIDVLNPEIYGP